MKRNFRLTSASDYRRVRRNGKSYAHPLVVLVVLKNEQEKVRVAVSAGRSVGKAVQRNRAKRLIREAFRPMLASINSGWDIILIARRPVAEAAFTDVSAAVTQLVKRAKLLGTNGEDGRTPA